MLNERVPNIEVANIATEICCILFLMTLFLALLLKRNRNLPLRFIMLIFAGELVALITDVLFRMFAQARPVAAALYADYVISFLASVFLVTVFTYYFFARFAEAGTLKVSVPVRWGVLIYALFISLLFLSSVWTGWFFYIDFAGKLTYTEWFIWLIYLFIPLAIYDVFVILRHRKILRPAETGVMLFYIILPVAALLIDIRFSTVTAHIALTLDACMLYTYVDAQQERKLANTRSELAEMHLNSMVSQINPHFLYNTLGSIESLMADRPDEARQLMSDFSEYLGGNYVDLTKQPMIPFQKELEHVDHYLAIQQVRFPNLNVEFDIKTTDFQVPALSLQPLVENAVKHGICRVRKSEGTVTVSSEERGGNYLIRVEDDGAGFDPSAPLSDDRPHIGIENVTRRLELLCGGTLSIHSHPGAGTIATITIPKGGTKH